MRVLVLGGTAFIGRRIVERLHGRGDRVLVVHRGTHEPDPWVAVDHLHTERRDLDRHSAAVRDFAPDAVVDAFALTAADVTAVRDVLPDVPAVVLSSQDVYQAFTGLQEDTFQSPVPLTERSALRRTRYPHRGDGHPGIPEDYEKLDVEEHWLARGAVVLRLPMVYGPHDQQRREDIVLRRLRAGRTRMPIGVGNLLWTRAHVDDVATGVLAALDTRAADGLAVNLGEPQVVPIRAWLEQIIAAAGADLDLVTVADAALPDELALTGAPAQHVVASVRRAEDLLGWKPADPANRVVESVRWHLAHPPGETWTSEDTARDEEALRASTGV